MSTGEESVMCMPMCQGFLKKRKDKMRLRWVTYWFKLHNATLFFYNKEHGSNSDLRGQYYLIEIESVREVMWTKKKHYSFEIALKNGKRKVLAAESADLRQQWICQLLQAINHRVCNTTELTSNNETALNNKGRTKSSPCNMFINTQSELRDRLVRTHHSAELKSYLWSPSQHPAVILTATPPIDTDVGLSHAESSQCIEDEINKDAEQTELENGSDILPPCKLLYSGAALRIEEEPIYDTPPSNRRLSKQEPETTENIYDVPKPALRKRSVDEASCAKELPEITGLLHDMVICLGGTSADWVRATAPGTSCQP